LHAKTIVLAYLQLFPRERQTGKRTGMPMMIIKTWKRNVTGLMQKERNCTKKIELI
jgi:hypothetical protein